MDLNQFEIVQCNICGSSEIKKFYPIRSGFLVKCLQCGLFYANPRRTESIRAVLTNKTTDKIYEAKTLNYQGRIQEFKNYLSIISNFKKPPGKLLDIGCYEGFFLNEARKLGWECYGVEPNIGGAKFARERLGLNVKQCVLEKAEFPDKFFDVITLLATLEHVPDPSFLLEEVKRIIKIDGILIVSVPTIPFYLSLIKSKWRMFIGDHYYFFDDNSIKKLFNKIGFNIILKQHVLKYVDLDTISARLADDWQPYNLGQFGKLLRKFIMKSEIKKVSIKINLFDSKVYAAKLDANKISKI